MPLHIFPGEHGPEVVYVPPLPPRIPLVRPAGNFRRDPRTGHLFRTYSEPVDRELFVGLDLGQAADWTALVLVERGLSSFTACPISTAGGSGPTRT
jgi:hypothetical protein